MKPTERVDVKTGFLCNNACLFCVQGDKRRQHGNKTTQEVKDTLTEARAQSDSIVFTGGEVTIREDFFELLAFAAGLGFSLIQVQTNGRLFSYLDFCRKAVDCGANEFSPALHGHIPELHDFLTRAPGSFGQTLKAIDNLVKLGQKVITNTVICRSNFRHLPQVAAVLLGHGVQQYQFAFVHPLGTAAKYFDSVVPRLSLIEPWVKRGLELGARARVPAFTEAIPYCFLTGYEWAAAERIIPRTRIFDANFVVEDYTEFRLTEGKARGEPCVACNWNQVCEGPWREYPERFGWAEFKPRTDAVPESLTPAGG